MPINVSSYLAPRVGGTYYLVEDNFVKGGYQSVATIALRDAIDPLNRKQGMLVYCADTDKVYKLGADLLAWTEFSSGTGTGTTTPGAPTITGFGGNCSLNDVITLSIQGNPNEQVVYKLIQGSLQLALINIVLDINGSWSKVEATQPAVGTYTQELTFTGRNGLKKTFTKVVQAGNSYSPAIAAYLRANPVSGADPDTWFATNNKRFLGDFTGTGNVRSYFQTKTVNGATVVGAIPNGTSTSSSMCVANSSDVSFCAALGFQIDKLTSKIVTAGSGGYPAMPIDIELGGYQTLYIGTDSIDFTGRSLYSYLLVRNVTGEYGARTTLDLKTTYNGVEYTSCVECLNFNKTVDITSFNGLGDITITAKSLAPYTGRAITLVIPAAPWENVYLKTATVSTSDARLKTAVTPLSEAELTAAIEICEEFGTYYFLKMLEEKGDEARKHVGTTVQRVIAILSKHGIDPFEYGFVCYDKWDSSTREDVNTVTKEVTETITPAGDLYSFRASELLFFCLRGMAESLKRNASKTDALQEQVAELRALLKK